MAYDDNEKVLWTDSSTVRAFEKSVDDGCIHRSTLYPFLGLTGETGEVLELVKKGYRKGGENWEAHVDEQKLLDELGDVLWYVTRCCQVFDCTLEFLMESNMEKLRKRRNGD